MDEKSKDAWRIFVLADTHNRLPEGVTEMAKAFETGRRIARHHQRPVLVRPVKEKILTELG
jgi:hypothetical protein